MSLDALIGATLAVGFPGPEAPPPVIEHLRRCHVGGIILFERNIRSPEQVRDLLRALRDGVGRRLLVIIDHEGGRVVRFRSGLTRFPSAQDAARRGDPQAIEQQGAVEADELRRLGIRVNLAPCVDVLAEGSDPVIGDRSYGCDADLVSRLAVARIRGLQSHGVAACAKHFPGLGAVPRDPHKVRPTVGLDAETMRRVHLAPFRAAIEAGVAMVMSSHVCYPALAETPELPATFSRRLMHDVLRQELGFAGVAVTDDLLMGGIRAHGSVGEAAVRAVEAGHDLLLICDDLPAQEEAFSCLRRAYQEGRLAEEALRASVGRLEALRRTFSP
jgi:beta-N-acetylhexosaminidase